MKQITDQLLWDYLDKLLSEEDRKELDDTLSNNASLSKRLSSIKTLHTSLRSHIHLQAIDREIADQMKLNILSLSVKPAKDKVAVAIFVVLGVFFASILLASAAYFKPASINIVINSSTVLVSSFAVMSILILVTADQYLRSTMKSIPNKQFS